jgi:hypothetical protein
VDDQLAYSIVTDLRHIFSGTFLRSLYAALRDSHGRRLTNTLSLQVSIFGLLCIHGGPCIPYLRALVRDPTVNASLVSIFSHWFGQFAAAGFLLLDAHDSMSAATSNSGGGVIVCSLTISTLFIHGKPLPVWQGGDGRTPLRPRDRASLMKCISQVMLDRRFSRLDAETQSAILHLEKLVSDQSRTARNRRASLRRTCDRKGCLENRIIGVCGKCRCSQYCSRTCQRMDRAAHRRSCIPHSLIST